MKTCCFCFDLKGGAIASAIFTLIIYVKAAIGCTIALILLNHVFNNSEELFIEHSPTQIPRDYQEAQYFVNIIIGVAFAVSALTALFCVLLLIGIQKGIRGLFFPWITLIGLKVGACVVFACLIIPLFGSELYPALMMVGILLVGAFYSYMIWCVSAYYNSLSAPTAVAQQTGGVGNPYIQFKEEFPNKLEKDTKPLV